MGKLIIRNDSDKTDADALGYVQYVVSMGRVSDNGLDYCFATTFKDGMVVYTIRNKKSDTFWVKNEGEG